MTKVKNFKGVCTVAHIRGTPNDKKGIRMTLRDNTDEIVWESWLATPEVRTGLFYYVSDPGVVEPHKEDGNRFKDSHDHQGSAEHAHYAGAQGRRHAGVLDEAD